MNLQILRANCAPLWNINVSFAGSEFPHRLLIHIILKILLIKPRCTEIQRIDIKISRL